MHTIWVRFHNRVAARLQAVNRHWTGERLFQVSFRSYMNYVFYGVLIWSEKMDRQLGKQQWLLHFPFTQLVKKSKTAN